MAAPVKTKYKQTIPLPMIGDPHKEKLAAPKQNEDQVDGLKNTSNESEQREKPEEHLLFSKLQNASKEDFYLTPYERLTETSLLPGSSTPAKIDSILEAWYEFQPWLARQINLRFVKEGKTWIHTTLSNEEFMAPLENFGKKLVLNHLIEKAYYGTQAATFIVSDGRNKVAVKLPYYADIISGPDKGLNSHIIKETEALERLQELKPPEYFSKLSLFNVDSFRGKCMVTNFIPGVSGKKLMLDDIRTYLALKLDQKQLEDLILFYKKAYAAGTIALWDAGGIANTVLNLENGKQHIIDLDPFWDDALEVQNKLFGKKPLAGVIFHMLTKDVLFDIDNGFYNFTQERANKEIVEARARLENKKAKDDDELVANFYSRRVNLLKSALDNLLQSGALDLNELTDALTYLLDLHRDASNPFKARISRGLNRIVNNEKLKDRSFIKAFKYFITARNLHRPEFSGDGKLTFEGIKRLKALWSYYLSKVADRNYQETSSSKWPIRKGMASLS